MKHRFNVLKTVLPLFGRRSAAIPASVLLVLGAQGGAFAQGMIALNNDVVGTIVTHGYSPLSTNVFASQVGNGTNDFPAGTTNWNGYAMIGNGSFVEGYNEWFTLVQLLIAPGFDQAESSLVPAYPTTRFGSGPYGGFAYPWQTVTATNVPAGGNATVEMVAWDSSYGTYTNWTSASVAWLQGLIAGGKSSRWNTTLGTAASPASLAGAQSFNVYFIRPKLAVTHSGNSVIVSWPYPSSNWTLQQNTNVPNKNGWQTSTYTITTNASVNSITITPPAGKLFFRLVQ